MENMEILQNEKRAFVEAQAGQAVQTFTEQQGYVEVSCEEVGVPQLTEDQRNMQPEAQSEVAPFNAADGAAIQYFNGHSRLLESHPHCNMFPPRRVECGAVIRNGSLLRVGWGTGMDVIGPLLDGVGVSRIHEPAFRNIAAHSPNWGIFRDELEWYIFTNNLPRWPNMNGLAHCHPSGTMFSTQDGWFSDFFNIPIYLVTAGNTGNHFRQLWRLFRGVRHQLR